MALPKVATVSAAVEAAVKEEVALVLKKDVVSIAPKKVNWDLKRDVDKKLAKLDRKTKLAIVQLLSESGSRSRAAAGSRGLLPPRPPLQRSFLPSPGVTFTEARLAAEKADAGDSDDDN